ncbi:MAG: DHH family phosphoesterase [Oscillospiraceae bacterium]|nr:DHH family phosphoesterase [Oscillospiraceae bacterium]
MNRIDAANFLALRDDFLILTHKNPDGDTVGSAAALCLALRTLGKRASILENPGFTARFSRYLEGLVGEASADATVVSVDVADASLLPKNAKSLTVSLAIDHHGTHREFCENRLVEPNSAACGEVILGVIDALGVSLTEEIARPLYLAIATDTGCFSFSNTTVDTHLIAARLFPLVPDAAAINHTFCVQKTRRRAALEARLLSEAEDVFGGACMVLTIPRSMMEELSLIDDDLDNIASIARAVEGVRLAIVIRELEHGVCKASLRSDPSVDSALICSHFSGGGHTCAAGCSIAGTPSEARDVLLSKIRELEVF